RYAQHLVTDDLVCKGEDTVQLDHRRRRRLGLEDHVVAVSLAVDLVGETALAPPVDVAALGPVRLDEGQPPLDRCPDRLLVQVRVEDDHDLVRSQRIGHQARPPSDRSAGCGPLRARAKRPAGGARCSVVEPGESIRSPRTSYRDRPYTRAETLSLVGL